jgi:hypothetical protein
LTQTARVGKTRLSSDNPLHTLWRAQDGTPYPRLRTSMQLHNCLLGINCAALVCGN